MGVFGQINPTDVYFILLGLYPGWAYSRSSQIKNKIGRGGVKRPGGVERSALHFVGTSLLIMHKKNVWA